MASRIKAIAIGSDRIDLIDKSVIGDLDTLTTTDKDSIVDAINEVNNKQGGGASYTAGTGIDITGDSISINQANLDKIAAVDNKADKTALNNYYTKTEANNLLNAKATTQALNNETKARTDKDTELTNQIATKMGKDFFQHGQLGWNGIALMSQDEYNAIAQDPTITAQPILFITY